jgi:arylsulfatase A-like enzyme
MKTAGLRWTATLGCVAFAAIALACSDRGAPAHPSLLLITVDTLRSDHVAGASLQNTPALARLASRGTRFDWAFSAAPTTSPSHVSMLTGKYPGFHTVGTRNGEQKLHDSTTTLAEVLSRRGYATAAIVSNPMLKTRLGLSQGFDLYDDEMRGAELNRKVSEQYADRAIDKALAWLDSKPSGPFFLWLHLQDPHGPYTPPTDIECKSPLAATETSNTLPPGETHMGEGEIPAYQVIEGLGEIAQYRHRYACEVAFMDRELGRFMTALEHEPEFSNLLTLMTSDHGEAMGEDGFWFAHGHSLSLDQVHVPLIATGPGFPAGKVVESPVSNVSIFATVIDVLGLEVNEDLGSALVGPSLAKVARGETTNSPARAIFVESVTQVGSIHRNAFLRRDRDLDQAFWSEPIGNAGGSRKRSGEQFIASLAGDHNSTSASRDELLSELRSYAARTKEVQSALASKREAIPELSGEELGALRLLGYVE